MIGTCDQSDEFLLVQMSAIMFKLYVLEVKRIRLEHVSYFRNYKWSFQIICEGLTLLGLGLGVFGDYGFGDRA